MAQMSSGKILQEARERKGYDLDTVARRLRIRPDILRAIEAGDFASMPPRGYTRNMVNAYARLVGLNPTEVVNMYLDEVYAFQVQRARSGHTSAGSYFDMGEATSRRARLTGRVARYDEDDDPSIGGSRHGGQRERVAAGERILLDDRTRFARDDYGSGAKERTSSRRGKSGRSENDFLSHHSSYPSGEFRFMDERSGGRFSRDRSIHVGTTPMEYSSSRIPSFLKGRLGIIIAAVIVIILLVLIVTAVRGCHKEPEPEETTAIPITGMDDTTNSDAEEAAAIEQATVAIAPTSARVAYAATSDEGCYVQIEQDGNQTDVMLDRTEETVDVTGTVTFATWTPDNLDLTVDGEKVQMQSNAEYGGMYTYTVDFNQILQDWQASHPDTSASRREAATAAAEAAQAQAQAAVESGEAEDMVAASDPWANYGEESTDDASGTTDDAATADDGTAPLADGLYYDEAGMVTDGFYYYNPNTGEYGTYDNGTTGDAGAYDPNAAYGEAY